MTTLKWFLILAFAGYGVFVALFYVAQRKMQYFPESFRTTPATASEP